MANTSLPTNLSPGTTGHIGHTNTVHGELNRLSQDTGWRNVTSFLANGWAVGSGGFVRIRREVDTVSVQVRHLQGSGSSDLIFLPLGSTESEVSSNFGPAIGEQFISPDYRDPSTPGGQPWQIWTRVFAGAENNGFRCGRTTSSGVEAPATTGSSVIEWSYHTTRPWPSFLPPAA